MEEHPAIRRMTSREPEQAGVRYATRHDCPPCSTYLKEMYGFDAYARHLFILAFKRARSSQVNAAPVDLRKRECRCAKGCNQDIFGPWD